MIEPKRESQEPPDWYDYADDLDLEDEGWDECRMMPDGQCLLAGTEWCDWDCPRNKP